jgi:hypothetical protein
MRRDLNQGYIELIHETGWEKPIQAILYKKFYGKIYKYRYFPMWNNFEEAVKWLTQIDRGYLIVINNQIKIGI